MIRALRLAASAVAIAAAAALLVRRVREFEREIDGW